jgi:phage baseplate assembly protein V
MIDTDPHQLAGDMLRLGTIESIDLAGAHCRVRVGEIITGDIPWLAPAAGATRIWCPPSVGQQVLLVCPDGDEEAGIAIGGIWSDAHPAPAGADLFHAEFGDGAILGYDPIGHALTVTLPAGGTAQIDAPGGLTIKGPVTIDGPLSVTDKVDVTGKLTASDDVVGGGKSLKNHVHTKVQAGGAVSGPPQ